jgi:uncharacterized protein YcbK (DUF882 family)
MNGMYAYFTKDELRCKCKACKEDDEVHMDEHFMEMVVYLREQCGFQFIVTSAYRCANHPAEAKKDKPGSHNSGKALDIKISGKRAWMLLQKATELRFLGIGISQKGDHDKMFIHIDMDTSQANRPWVWSY